MTFSSDHFRATATVDLGAIRHNLRVVRALAGDARVLAVVKADAYGHGLDQVAPALSATDGYAVATLAEALVIRRLGLAHRVLLLEGVASSEELAAARQHHLDVVVHHSHQLELLKQASDRGPLVNVWLKFDTGMHRLGFPLDDANAVRTQLESMPQVATPIRWMSHLARANEPGNDHSQEQIRRFEAAIGDGAGERTLANSAALLAWPGCAHDWIRAGLLLYGVSPLASRPTGMQELRPAMRFTTRLLAVNQCEAGDPVGYGGDFVCPESMRIGIAGVGYGDGYPLSATRQTPVLVNGQRCALAGRVSMDLLGIDLRAAPDAQVGDEVLLWGPELPLEEVAGPAGSIPWELLCRVSRRVQFVYRDDA